MAYRARTNKGRDAKIYRKTANKTKKINICPKMMRGGIRL